jgi:hypothetical protein
MMFNLSKIIIDGCLLSIVASLWLILIMRINPRIFLQDYPKDIQAAVHPKTPSEKKLTLWLGIPFLLLLILFPFFSTLGLKRKPVHTPHCSQTRLASPLFSTWWIGSCWIG